MILDSLSEVFSDRFEHLRTNVTCDPYERVTQASVLRYVEDGFTKLIKPTVSFSQSAHPTDKRMHFELSINLLRTLMAEIHDAGVQDHILNESMAFIATHPGIFLGGAIDQDHLKKVVTSEASNLQRLVERSITVHGMEFPFNPDTPKPKM